MFNRDDSAFTLAAFLVLSALGLFAWNAAPLNSARPTSEKIEPVDRNQAARIPARLWQDPLKAIVQFNKRYQTDKRHPVTRKPWSDLLKEHKDQPVIVLSVMVSSESYAEVEESRRRRRYAVLSALSDSGYVPSDADSLGIICDPDGTIAYEWFEYESPVDGKPDSQHKPILVAWLKDSDYASEPFKELHKLLSETLKGRTQPNVSWKVIGPATSDTLLQMVKDGCNDEVEHIAQLEGLASFQIISPMATVPNDDLSPYSCSNDKQVRQQSKNDNILGPFFSPHPGQVQKLFFRRTIRSDDVLIAKLVEELRNRRFEDNDAIAVISEWDTYFGRTLPRILHDELKQDKFEEKFLRYTYERGIDGVAPGMPQSKAEESDHAARSSLEELTTGNQAAIRRPEGTGQFDYLRRLGNQILEEDQRLRLENGRGVRAVAVLGSDVYDKLLILRALRPRLPGTLWLTTDIDAHLLHPSEFQWTRNLVVASSYGLLPGRKINTSTPPFRDGYQTSTYIATRMAVDPSSLPLSAGDDTGQELPTQEQINNAIPAQLFEVGRYSFVPLRKKLEDDDEKDEGKKDKVLLNIADPPDSTKPYLLGTFLITLLGLLAIQQLRPNATRIVVGTGAAIGILLLLALWIHHSSGAVEPFGIREGVSVWPTEFIRLGALFLAIFFIFRIRRKLRSNWQEINQRYLDYDLSDASTAGSVQSCSWFDRLSTAVCNCPAWALGSLLLFVVMMGAMIALRLVSMPLSRHLVVLALVWAVVIGLWLAFISGKLVKSTQVLAVNKWASDIKLLTLHLLWMSYGEYGANQHRVLRTLAYTLVYFAFASIVFTLLGGGGAPCRGTLACSLDGFITGLAVLAMLFLLFLVVDATRLCIFWIRKLLDPELHWEDKLLTRWAKRLGVPPSHTKYWLQIHLIGERTTEIGRLLYYPLLVILLMIASRSTYFDNWGFPQALAIVVGLNFTIALVTAFRLNHTARTARSQVIDRLQRERQDLREQQTEEPPQPTLGEIRDLVKELSEVHMGAYQRPWEQPFIRSALMLIAGFGISYSEYLPLG